MIKQAVILAGGKGTRLMPLTKNIPKPMAPVNKIPFLSYLIQNLKKAGFKKILILVGYKSDIIYKYFNSFKDDSIKVEFSYSNIPSNTGRRVINAYKLLDNNFMLLYGDNYWKPNIKKMYDKFTKLKALITMTIFNNKDGTGEYGKANNTYISSNSRVLIYDKLRKQKDLNGVNIGFYILKKKLLESFLNQRINYSFEDQILMKAIKTKKCFAYRTDKKYLSITNIKMLKKFEKYVNSNNEDFIN